MTETYFPDEGKQKEIITKHFESKGYQVHSGLQFGSHLVLYTDDPRAVHSDFCVQIVPSGGILDWRTMQVLVRLMSDVRKNLILAHVKVKDLDKNEFIVEEISIGSEHAPMRLKKVTKVGAQVKKRRVK